ncbi:Non-specific serine/threonine protein kinase [Bertholletia excelsa]
MGISYIGRVFLLGAVLLVQSCTSKNFFVASFFSNFTDQFALLAFKSAIKHDPHGALANWTATTNFCSWAGVSCGRRRQRITALQLQNMSLVGTISPFIGNLSFLRVLRLQDNSFHGSIMHEIGELRRLEILTLYSNHLEGEIPTSIQHCKRLEMMSLSYNFLSGEVPAEVTTLPSISTIFLGGNNLTGRIPASIGNLSSLELFALERNKMFGEIPFSLGHLPNLKLISFGKNYLMGPIPPPIFNISSLEQVVLSRNSLLGTLPPSTGLRLPNLQNLQLDFNQLTGELPQYLSNASKLVNTILAKNRFKGPLSTNFGQLKYLEKFLLYSNQLTLGPRSSKLDFLTSMTNCTSLRWLIIDDNPFDGVLPDSIGNLSSTLEWFTAVDCQLKGEIPSSVGYLKLNILYLYRNNLRGKIPSTIGEMETLQRLDLSDNELEGLIPDEICLLYNVGEIYLARNKLYGSIPGCIDRNLSRLQKFDLSSNKLNSSIPLSLWGLENLLFLDLSSNLLAGSLDLKPIRILESINLSSNKISGKIPSTLGAFESIGFLDLSGNSLWGPIPESIGDLITLDYLDLSNNHLSGTIPKTLELLSHLQFLNLSSNRLSGEIPNKGPFRNLTAKSFMDNGPLCGQLPGFQMPPCPSHKTQKSWTNKFLKFILPAISLSISLVVCLILWKKFHRKNAQYSAQDDRLPPKEHKLYSYPELCLATNDFCETNLLGEGSHGSVYKGILNDGQVVAVKILNLQVEGAFKSFDTECKIWRTVRHRNLVKVISTCSNVDSRALILEFMPQGSLDKWLHTHNYYLNLHQRLGVVIDVALALEYLHHHQVEPIIHCDLKPSNILLDEDMVGHVADFGIAKILDKNRAPTQTRTLGTMGYIAPEYGSEGLVSTKVDIYSFGVMLLEAFTGKRPTYEMFTEEISLTKWINTSLPEKYMEVVDSNLLRGENGQDLNTVKDEVLAIMELGLQCSANIPYQRPDIKDVTAKLNKIKLKLLPGEELDLCFYSVRTCSKKWLLGFLWLRYYAYISC